MSPIPGPDHPVPSSVDPVHSISKCRLATMRETIFCFMIVSVSFLTYGCTSLHKNAEILMEGEEYAEAAKVYTSILEENPKDAAALVGLKKARNGWIDKSLIDVRMLRLSQQAAPAIDLLKKIIEREREWQFYPEGAVQYTQQEETKYAIRLIAAQVEAWQAKGHLLKARAYIEAYQQIFATPAHISRYERILSQLTHAAKSQCATHKVSSKIALPYFTTFAKRYCDSWGIAFDAGFDVAKTRANSLFKEIDVVFKIAEKDPSGIPEVLHPYEREVLHKEFKSTAWYDKDASARLAVNLKASFSHDHEKRVEAAVHSYTVQVPYIEMIPQMRTIPHTTYQRMCTGLSCTSLPSTTYRYETYMVPVTRYRSDPRQFKFDRWRHVQTLAFHSEILSLIQGMEVNASHTQTAGHSDTEHPHSLPDIGLSPDILSLPDPLRWLEKQIDEVAHNWGQALTSAWTQMYCKAPEQAVDETTTAEYVLRCLRAAQSPVPSFAEAWFKETFGADYRTVVLWLDRVDTGQIPSLDIQEKD